MKLYFDQNLPRILTKRLSDVFPESAHVLDRFQGGLADRAIWRLADRDGYIIVTKDRDFLDLSALYGAPPKVILIGLGNCSTSMIERLLRGSLELIDEFVKSDEAAALILP